MLSDYTYYLSQALPDRSALESSLGTWGGVLAGSVGEASFVVVDPDTSEGAELVSRLGWLPQKDAKKGAYRGTCVTAKWVWTQLEHTLEDAVEKMELRVLAAGGDAGDILESFSDCDEMDEDLIPLCPFLPESSTAPIYALRNRADLNNHSHPSSSNPLRVRLVLRSSSLTPRQHAHLFSPYPSKPPSSRAPSEASAKPSARKGVDADGVRTDFDEKVAAGEDGRPAWCPIVGCERHYKDSKGLSQHFRRAGHHGLLARQLWAKLKRAGRLPSHLFAAPESPERDSTPTKLENPEEKSPKKRRLPLPVSDPTLPSPGPAAAATSWAILSSDQTDQAAAPATVTTSGMVRSHACPVCGKSYLMEKKLRTHMLKPACAERLPSADVQKLQNGQLPSQLRDNKLERLPSPASVMGSAAPPQAAAPSPPEPMEDDEEDQLKEEPSDVEEKSDDRSTPDSMLSSALPPSMRNFASPAPALGLRRITSTPASLAPPTMPLPRLPKFALPSASPSAAPSTPNPTLSTPTGDLRPFKCPNPSCAKSWKNKNGLKYHLNHGNCNGVLSSMSRDDANALERPFMCPVPGCNKRWKNANGFRYHMEHTGAHGRTARKLHDDAGEFGPVHEVYGSSVVPDEVEEED